MCVIYVYNFTNFTSIYMVSVYVNLYSCVHTYSDRQIKEPWRLFGVETTTVEYQSPRLLRLCKKLVYLC